MISSVYQLCYILDITVILTTFQNIQEKVLRNLSSNFFLHIPKSYSDIVQYRVGYYYIFFSFLFFEQLCMCCIIYDDDDDYVYGKTFCVVATIVSGS